MDTKGGKQWGGGGGAVMNWEIGIDIYTLIFIKWITNKNVLCKKINKIKFKKKTIIFGLPWWFRVKDLPFNTGDMGSIPGRGTKIPNATDQLSLHALEPV